MRCERAKKLLSDELDGALSVSDRALAAAHLRGCSACRAYREDLVRLQAGAGAETEPSPEYWAGFEARLAAKLDAVPAGRRPAGSPGASRRRLAWAAAGCLVLAAAGAYLGLVRKAGGNGEAAWVAYEDELTPLLQEAEADAEFGRLLEREVLASIGELAPAAEADAVIPADDPLFWEGLSDAELEMIAAELGKETGLGGPK
jgi:predicted anti-sigma-YlaC factor YlaD